MTELPLDIERLTKELSIQMGQYADGKFQAVVGADGDVCIRKSFIRPIEPMARVATAIQELKEAMQAAYGEWPSDQSQMTRGAAVVVLGAIASTDKVVWSVEPRGGANG